MKKIALSLFCLFFINSCAKKFPLPIKGIVNKNNVKLKSNIYDYNSDVVVNKNDKLVIFARSKRSFKIRQVNSVKYDFYLMVALDNGKRGIIPRSAVKIIYREGQSYHNLPTINDLQIEINKSAINNDVDRIKYLVKHGASINGSPIYPIVADPLTDAARLSKFDAIKYIVSLKPSQKTLNKALMWAVHRPNIEIVKFLLKHGADVNSRDMYKRTTLISVVHTSYDGFPQIEMAKLLIKAGADLNAKDNENKTAAMWAKHYRNIKLLKLLVNQ